ncbi:MAG: EAL domain-containing protein [Azoarcus sp.]|jgi:diguanylate cyclase (GGDEF)-like protein/PAS domain S-box-containing protein|nr:EAL domain-containing protein [Azoarcus sp.]
MDDIAGSPDVLAGTSDFPADWRAAFFSDCTIPFAITSFGEGRFIDVNKAFETAFGWKRKDLLGATMVDVGFWRSSKERGAFLERFDPTARSPSQVVEVFARDGVPHRCRILASLQREKDVPVFFVVFVDVHEGDESSDRNFYTYHDPLTRLPNRALLLERLEHLIKRTFLPDACEKKSNPSAPNASAAACQMALLYVDLDRFKNVNDSLGHPMGDTLLQVVSNKMSALLRESDLLARIGGDEFIILLEAPITAAAAAGVARRVLSLFAAPITLQDQEIYMSASIGISLFPRDGADSETLIRHADLAMYKAKNEGRNTFRFYEAALGVGIKERMSIEHDLRGALKRNEFVIHYQPQISLSNSRLVGVEALLRWLHPERGLIPPGNFISIAEDIGIISDIGAWVLRESCRQLALWDKDGFDVNRVAVNLSVQQLEHSNLVAIVREALDENGLSPRRLELEVTESILMQKTERTLAVLTGLKTMGVRLAIDDFGTGYSSLGYLKSLPVHLLKIDYSFVRDIGHDASDEAITRAVIALSSSLGLETVAEGVEREEQENFLRREGCQIVQGFLYARPLPAEELRARFGVNH